MSCLHCWQHKQESSLFPDYFIVIMFCLWSVIVWDLFESRYARSPFSWPRPYCPLSVPVVVSLESQQLTFVALFWSCHLDLNRCILLNLSVDQVVLIAPLCYWLCPLSYFFQIPTAGVYCSLAFISWFGRSPCVALMPWGKLAGFRNTGTSEWSPKIWSDHWLYFWRKVPVSCNKT